ncbi:hypothetical protein AAI421_18240 [Rhodococcus aetherivorans]|uniref:hypothetical protein n=1 Tax=Rhodococcus aetherivorans TaxID=191292 RepID=UPI0031D61AA1
MTVPLQILVERSDIEARLGETLAGPEVDQVNSLIAFASAKIRALVENIDGRVMDGTLDVELVRGTLATVICRALDALRIGLRVRSEQYPEISTTYADSDGALVYFTEDEIGPLKPDRGVSGGAFTIWIG